MERFKYYQPGVLEDAFALMAEHEGRAQFIAGGTDVMVRVNQRAIQPEALISLRGVDALKGITPNGEMVLGSMTLFRDIERNPFISRDYPALARAVAVLANPQVRNVATIGGNLCNGAPSADCAPPLLVLEARLTLEGPEGERSVPIRDFFKGPGQHCMNASEVMTGIVLPEIKKGTGSAFLKAGRVSQDIAVVNAAALVVMEGDICKKCRLSVGAVAPVPLRLTDIETMVEGRAIHPDLLGEVAERTQKAVSPITDVRSTEAYRRQMSGVLVKRALKAALKVAREEKAESVFQTQVPADISPRQETHTEDMAGNTSGEKKEIRFTLNGHEVSVEVEPHKTLLRLLRDHLRFKGTKEGCGQGECGACTVLVDGLSVDSCLYPAFEAAGKTVTTIEGLLGEGNVLDPTQAAFVAHGGVQCGFCTPGMIMSARNLLNENPNPTDAEIRRGISGNLCRCTGYVQIVESIKEAAVVEPPSHQGTKTGIP
ncbi:MAG: FAD binding domain-containing protein [Deltaproteobacteria bacterium]|nr:FAD binding domain-containing protein [Deltaproteobacteria bacterium]